MYNIETDLGRKVDNWMTAALLPFAILVVVMILCCGASSGGDQFPDAKQAATWAKSNKKGQAEKEYLFFLNCIKQHVKDKIESGDASCEVQLNVCSTDYDLYVDRAVRYLTALGYHVNANTTALIMIISWGDKN